MSEEDQEQEQLVEAESGESESPGWVIPFNLSIDKLDIITKACFAAKADSTPATLDDIARVAAVHARSTGPNLRFLVSIGVLTFDNRTKRFSLTKKGVDYCKQLGTGDTKAAGEVLKELLPNSHLKEVLGFISVQGKALSYDSLFNHIKTLARVKTDTEGKVSDPVRAGIRCLIGLLDRAGFISEGLISQAIEPGRHAVSVPKRTARVSKDQSQESGESDMAEHEQAKVREGFTVTKTPFTINITIEAKDAEAIKQVIELVKKLRGDEEPAGN